MFPTNDKIFFYPPGAERSS